MISALRTAMNVIDRAEEVCYFDRFFVYVPLTTVDTATEDFVHHVACNSLRRGSNGGWLKCTCTSKFDLKATSAAVKRAAEDLLGLDLLHRVKVDVAWAGQYSYRDGRLVPRVCVFPR